MIKWTSIYFIICIFSLLRGSRKHPASINIHGGGGERENISCFLYVMVNFVDTLDFVLAGMTRALRVQRQVWVLKISPVSGEIKWHSRQFNLMNVKLSHRGVILQIFITAEGFITRIIIRDKIDNL